MSTREPVSYRPVSGPTLSASSIVSGIDGTPVNRHEASAFDRTCSAVHEPIVRPIQTGWTQIKKNQRERSWGGLPGILLGSEWTDWLPIFAWLIDHPEGPIVVDTGETARTAEIDYFPRWHPYYRSSVRMRVTEEDEIGPRLEAMDVDPDGVATVVLTHLHTDHAGGLEHFPNSDILVSETEYRRAQGVRGRVQGYLPHSWPAWFEPTLMLFEDGPAGPFARSHRITEAGDVIAVPTPGHTEGHVSVLVESDEARYFLAGDASYTEQLLLDRVSDGVGTSKSVTLETQNKILELAAERPLVYLPSHDPDSPDRLRNSRPLSALDAISKIDFRK